MGNVMKRKLQKYHSAILVLCMCIFCVFMSVVYIFLSDQDDEKYIRVEVNSILTSLMKQGIDQVEDLPKTQFQYTVFYNDGTVVLDTSGKYDALQKVDLSTIGASSQYIVPIVVEGENSGILVVTSDGYQKQKVRKFFRIVFLVMLAGVIGLLIIFYAENIFLKQDFWQPLESLHDSTKKILLGNYEEHVFYDYKGEIGTLCHDFEKMRDNLEHSREREMELKNKEQVLYASISHDLKTPIAIVKGHLEEIAFEVVTDKEQMKQSVENCLAKINGISKLTDDILAHSKAELGQLPIKKQEIYSDEYFGELLKELFQDAKNGGYQLNYNLPPRLLVEFDPDRINEVVFNIVGNAVKYSGDDLCIDISFEIQNMQQKVLIMMIHDNGYGIEAADLPFIFDLFYRGNKSRTQDIPGSGLGLHISKYIVEKHGGNIECDSILGVGTTISFSIPVY